MPSEKAFITLKNKSIFVLASAFVIAICGLTTAGIVNSTDANEIDLAVKKDLLATSLAIESGITSDGESLKPGAAVAIKDMELRPKVTHSDTVMQVAGDSQGYCLTAQNKEGKYSEQGYTYFSTTRKVLDSNSAKCANGEIIPEILPDEYSPNATTTLTDPVDLSVEDDMQEVAFKIREKVKADPKLASKFVTFWGIEYTLNHPKTTLSIGGTGENFCVKGVNEDGTWEASKAGLYYSSVTDKMSNKPCDMTNLLHPLAGQAPQSDIPYTAALTVPLLDSSLPGSEATGSDTLVKSGGVMGGLALLFSSAGYLTFRKPRTVVAAVTKKGKSENIRDWDALIAHYETIIREWASYELDLVKIIDLPLLTDMTHPVTAAFYKSLIKARGIAPSNSRLMSKIETFDSPFSNSVQELEFNLEALVQEAKKVRWTGLTPKERSSLKRAQNLLNIALNQASSASERQVAYKQLMKEVEGIVVIPKATLLSLEANNQLRLDA